jgi:energy-coupling factor transport system ATP-binding protein
LAVPEPEIAARDLTLGFDPRTPVIQHLDLRLTAGERVAILGSNGAGKSSLAIALAGLTPPLAGEVWVDGFLAHAPATRRQVASRIGILFQDPETQLVTGRVEEEIALPLQNLGWAPARITARVSDVLHELGLEELAQRAPRALSGGEMQRVALGAALASEPSYLICDEPTAHLDPAGAAVTTSWIEAARRRSGVATVELACLAPALPADRGVVLDHGRAIHDGPWPLPADARARLLGPRTASPLDLGPLAPTAHGVRLETRALVAGWGGRAVVLAGELRLEPGTITTLRGPSGSGKSTLLLTLAGWIPPLSGEIRVSAPGTAVSSPRAGEHSSLVLQFPERLFCRPTVGEELRDFGVRPGEEGPALGALGLPVALRDRSPFRLAAGEARRLALALALLARHPLLLLDEPGVGLDAVGHVELEQLIAAFVRAGGAVMIASHDPELLALGNERLRVEGGRVVEDAGRDQRGGGPGRVSDGREAIRKGS